MSAVRSIRALSLAAIVLFTVCSADAPPRTQHPRPRPVSGVCTLVWRDEFSTPGPVNERDWIYEKGFVRNQGSPVVPARQRHVQAMAFSSSKLGAKRPQSGHFEKDSPDWKKPADPSLEYSSGSIKTRGTA
jgi:hypothetical protein